jgi:hypothetical protein
VSGLLDITTNFAMDEEAVGAIFLDAKGKWKEDATEGSASHDPKKNKKGRPGKQQCQKDALVTVVDRKKPRGPLPGPWEFLMRWSRRHAPITDAQRSTP